MASTPARRAVEIQCDQAAWLTDPGRSPTDPSPLAVAQLLAEAEAILRDAP